MSKAISNSALKIIRKYSACDAADALSRLGFPQGGFLPGLVMHSPCFQGGETRIAGPAQTVKFQPNALKGQVPEIKDGHYIDKTQEGHILFLSSPPRISNAIYGGIMSARAKHLGALGTIISGRVRDVNEQRNQDWPLFARGVGTTAGGGACFASEMNVPIEVPSVAETDDRTVTVNPGDILVADADGVVCIPKDMAERVAEILPQLNAADAACLADVLKGRSVSEAFKEHRGRLRC